MISGITNDATTAAAAAAMKKATGMNKDDFLQLFITQLKNQDPLNPQDSSEFLAQLSQLTQVEQAYNTNTNLKNLQAAFSASANLGAVSFIGKEVQVEGNEIALTQGSTPRLGYSLDHKASQVALAIMDSTGQVVRTLTAGSQPAGESSLVWDGKGVGSKQLPPGRYTYTVTAQNAQGEKVGVTPLVTGKVDGVKLQGEQPVVTIGGLEVPIANIRSVKGVT